VRGGAAGTIATAAMSVVMLGARRAGVVSKLAPEHVTEAGMAAADVDRDERTEDIASTAVHLAFGAGTGVVFALVAPHVGGPPVAKGLVYGAGVLLVSYEGWVPAARILPPLHAQTPGGRWTLIASHAVFGATLGALAGD
jgi:uncharacterized membrane protein YagU involved in acid resistance